MYKTDVECRRSCLRIDLGTLLLETAEDNAERISPWDPFKISNCLQYSSSTHPSSPLQAFRAVVAAPPVKNLADPLASTLLQSTRSIF